MNHRAIMMKLTSLLLTALTGCATASVMSMSEVPIEVSENHIYVRVRVESSEPLWFLVDSGAAAPVNIIDRAAATRMGLPVEGEQTAGAIGGSTRVAFTPPVALQIGSTRMPAAPLAVMALSEQEGEEHPVDGILGYAFFVTLNPEIDYPNSRMRLSEEPVREESADAVPFELVNKSVRISVQLQLTEDGPSVPAVLLVDTGYDADLALTTPFVKRHGLLAYATGTISGRSLGGETAGATMEIPELRVGRHRARNIETRLSTDEEGAFASDEVDGYVGSGLLKRYSVLFDYAHQRLALSSGDDVETRP